MKHVIRYVVCLMNVLLLTLATASGTLLLLTRGAAIEGALKKGLSLAQHRVEWNGTRAVALYGLGEESCLALLNGTAEGYMARVGAWWGSLFETEDAPAFPDQAVDEGAFVQAIMADEGFRAAVPEDMRRATARDEVTYQLDEIIREQSVPLRQSIAALGEHALRERVSLPRVRGLMKGLCLGAAALGIILLLLNRRCAGITLTSSAGTMALIALGVALMNIPGMLHALNPVAEIQGKALLLMIAGAWLGTAAILGILGVAILKMRRDL